MEIMRFGPFELDARTGELRKRGIRVRLQDQALRVLVALLERPGEIVSRQELRLRLWPADTFVDFEHGLNAAVRRLRLSLGDRAELPCFIETIHKRGYRFLPTPLAQPHADAQPRIGIRSFMPGDEFSAGLTSEILTHVVDALTGKFAVLARVGADRDAHSPADFLIDGNIRRDGEQLRVSAQLVDVQKGTNMWAASFDRVSGNSLTLQAELAGVITRQVSTVLASSLPRPTACRDSAR